MKFLRKLLIPIVLIFSSFSASAACDVSGAPTLVAASTARSEVEACITAAAASGSTIVIPAGSSTWTGTAMQINKAVDIIGAGPGVTNITASTSEVFRVNPTSAKNVRISNMTISGSGTGCGLETCIIHLQGTLDTVRIDNITFTNVSGHAVYIGDWDTISQSPRVLFHNITFNSNLATFSRFLKLEGVNSVWKEDDRYGTEYFVYIEDSSFSWTNTPNTDNGVSDTEYGGRLVVRHSTVTNGGIQVHDTGSTDASKGQRASIVHNVTFTCNLAGCDSLPAIGVRGGGWLLYDNTFNRIGGGAISDQYFTSAFPQIWRSTEVATGSNWIGECKTGATVVKTCDTPTFYHCSAGDFRACPYANGPGCPSGTCVRAATSSATCPAGVGFIADLDRVNGGSDPTGYPCRNQTGWGKEYSNGTREVPSPVYWWGNSVNGSANANFPSSHYNSWFQLNRDQCNVTLTGTGTEANGVTYSMPACGTKEAWTYKSYPYPHPLRSGWSSRPNAPTVN